MYELKRILSFNHPIRDLAQLSPQPGTGEVEHLNCKPGVINCLRRLGYFLSVSRKRVSTAIFNQSCARILLYAPNIRVAVDNCAPAQASNPRDRERCAAVSSKANRG